MNAQSSSSGGDVSLTYKFLLIFSTLAAVFFCWLYVTKPTEIVQAATSAPSDSVITEGGTSTPQAPEASSMASSLVDAPSLPGMDAELPSIQPVDPSSGKNSVPVPSDSSTERLVGFEETNDAIQHVLLVQSDQGNERVILEVPVIYQTRGLRFSPAEANEAGRILRALKIYHAQVKKLHTDGQNIQRAWDKLLMDSQPIEALRADSPSLPHSTINHASLLEGKSKNTIKVSK
ncbi:hypothetical protein [Rubritalea marina]|uniref:hypothetical protein n=1 Tax=Rubritalea marina TaxID=361055 RepID=UPI0003739A35|nr:hypothetical protein [Rubritalea marina]